MWKRADVPEERSYGDELSIAISQLSLTTDLISIAPNVRLWKTDQTVLWLQDVFDGAEALISYEASFRSLGITGTDLLNANKELLKQFGITNPVHMGRAESSIEQLSKYQKEFDKVNVKQARLEKDEKNYHDLLKEWEKNNATYNTVDIMSKWSSYDVFHFLKKPSNTEVMEIFIKPIAMQRLNGEELLELCKIEKLADIKLAKLDPTIDQRLWDRFRKAVLLEERTVENAVEALRLHRETALLGNLKPFSSKPEKKKQLGAGAFGITYLVKYTRLPENDTKEYALKTFKKQPDEKAVEGDDRSVRNKALQYEAALLNKASHPGVVRFIAFNNDDKLGDAPSFLMEYVFYGSLEKQLADAESGDRDSIFHPKNERNVIEEKRGMKNPILLQYLRIGRELAAALDFVHSKGIVHLDVAARNVLIGADRRPKLSDFGSAALEEDMLKHHELCKVELSKMGSRGDPSLRKAELISRLKSSSLDRITLQSMQSHMDGRRALAWFPDWTVESFFNLNPLLDRHVDEYSFGCVLYEMIARKTPHGDLPENEVKQLKRSGHGDPIIPSNIAVDTRLVSIMRDCWRQSNQLSMKEASKQLSDLHKTLMSESYLKDTTSYFDLKTLAGKPPAPPTDAEKQSSNYSADAFSMAEESAAKYSFMPNDAKPALNIQSGNISIQFPTDVDRSAMKFSDYEDVGISKELLTSAISTSFIFRDHDMVVLYAEAVVLMDHIDQIGMIATCLRYIDEMSKDDHCDDVDDTWQRHLAAIIRIIVKSTTTTLSQALDEEFTTAALSALAAVLKKVANHDEAKKKFDNIVFRKTVCDFLSNSYQKFQKNISILTKTMEAFSAAISFSVMLRDHLHQVDNVSLTLQTIKDYLKEASLVTVCCRALEGYNIEQLIHSKPSISGNVDNSISGDAYKTIMMVFKWCLEAIEKESSKQAVSKDIESLVETAALLMFRQCESVSYEDGDILHKFLTYSKEEDIAIILKLARHFSEVFRIQEGCIGLLAYMVSMSDDYEEENVEEDGKKVDKETIVSSMISGERRIKALISLEPNLKHFLECMERFRVDDRIANEIKKKKHLSQEEMVMNTGVFSASVSTFSGSKSSKTSLFTSRSANSNTLVSQFQERLHHELFEVFVDEYGNHISAASLHKSVAKIIGVACMRFQTFQENLTKTRYNELILLSFENFYNDNELIKYGCHAFYAVCRGHAMHQRQLKGKNIISELSLCLRRHDTIWEIADAVICTLTGLMEPANTIPSYMTEERSTFSSMLTPQATFIGGEIADMASILIRSITYIVCENLPRPECFALVSNFFNMLSTMIFWKPSMFEDWKIDLSKESHFKQYLELLQQYSKVKISLRLDGEDAKLNAFELPESLLHEVKLHALIPLAISFHQNNPNNTHLMAIGLSLLTQNILRQIDIATNDTFVFGSEVPYFSSMNILFTRLLYILKGVKRFCLYAPETGVNHPVLIRYSLWLLLLFISDTKQYIVEDENLRDLLEDGKQLAGSLSKITIEWAVEVLEQFRDYYSLISLATVYLTWMEKHGHFKERSVERLKRMKSLLAPHLHSDGKVFNYKSLNDEGHDVFMIDKTPKELFGDLPLHVDKLIRLIDFHIEGQIIKNDDQEKWDGVCRPLKIDVVSCDVEEDPETLKSINVFTIRVLWNVKLKRGGLATDELSREEEYINIARSYKQFLKLQDDLTLEFSHLDSSVFTTNRLPPVSFNDIVKEKLNKTEFQENRRMLLQNWMGILTNTRAIFFSSSFRLFLDSDKATISLRNMYTCHPVITEMNFPVKAICHDTVSGIMIVGTGRNDDFLGSSSTVRGCLFVYKLVADTSSYSRSNIIWTNKDTSLVRTCTKKLSHAVSQISWDRSRRCVFTGLRSGSVIFWHLNDDNFTLTYVTEIDYHQNNLRLVEYYPSIDSLFCLSKHGMMGLYDMNASTTVSQSATFKTHVTAVAYDYVEKMAFCGTEQGFVAFFNFNSNPPRAMQTIHGESQTSKGIDALAFDVSSRVLYVASQNIIRVFRILGSGIKGSSSSELGKFIQIDRLKINDKDCISYLLLIHNGRFIVTGTNAGDVAIFDMSNKTDDRELALKGITHTTLKSKHSSSISAAVEDANELSKASVVQWDEVILKGNTAMRDWLRAKGVDTSSLFVREDYIRAIFQYSNVDPNEAGKILYPTNPCKDVLFAAKLNEDMIHYKSDFIRCATYLDELRIIAFGCQDGKIRFLSLADFLPAVTSSEKMEMQRSLQDMLSKKSATIQPANKSTRGKRQIIS